MKATTLSLLFLAVLIGGCVHAPPKDFSKLEAAKPASILVVPVVNESVEVTAPDYFLSTVPIPLAELGYYVFPVNLVKRILEDDGLSDANLVHSAPAEKLCSLFGSDAVLYVAIKEWNAQYLLLTTTVNVGLGYNLKDCKTGETVWTHNQRMRYQPQNTSTGNIFADLAVMAVSAAMTKAAPNYMPLAVQANSLAFYGGLQPVYKQGYSLPLGPYALPESSARQ